MTSKSVKEARSLAETSMHFLKTCERGKFTGRTSRVIAENLINFEADILNKFAYIELKSFDYGFLEGIQGRFQANGLGLFTILS
jgi:hypothetical protein